MKKKVLALALSMALIFCSTANVAFAATDEDSEEGDSEIVVEEIIEEGDDAESEDLETEDPEADEFEDSDLEVDESTPNSGECGDNLTWVLDEEGTLTISGTGPMWFEYDHVPWDCNKIKKVVIEKGVTTIADDAFNDCNNLTDVTIPDSVETIGWYSFYECSSLKNITIPNSVISIDYRAFSECTSLSEITLSSELTCIESYTFYGCSSLKEIVIPDKVTSIGSEAFAECTSLEEITIPSSVSSIAGGAFEGTPWAEKNADENGLLIVNNILVECQSNPETVSVPEDVVSITDAVFSYKDSIKKVQIPNSVTSIGEMAFESCVKLTDVNIPDSLTDLQYNLFKDCTSLTEIEIPESVESIEKGAFYNTGLTSVIIPESVTDIGEVAFGYKSVEDENGDIEEATVEGFTIYGYAGSAAETYANENAFDFVEIKESVTGLSIVPEKTDEVYVRGSGTGAVIYCTGEFSKFVSVEMDGEIVDPSNYTVVEGSTVLTFASSYLDTLSLGRHVVTLNYIDDSISTFLTIVDKDGSNLGTNAGNNPNFIDVSGGNGSTGNTSTGSNTVRTGDGANIALWLILGIVSVAGCVFASKTRKKSARR